MARKPYIYGNDISITRKKLRDVSDYISLDTFTCSNESGESEPIDYYFRNQGLYDETATTYVYINDDNKIHY